MRVDREDGSRLQVARATSDYIRLGGVNIIKLIPKMPDKFKGEYKTGCGYTSTAPRKWTSQEIEFLQKLKVMGYSNREIAYSLDRSETSISIKLKRLSKKQNTYNKNHIAEKYELNNAFLDVVKPKTILDLYCGEKSFYAPFNAVTNDVNKDIPADYHEDALKLICKLYHDGCKFDFVDLDPFGSAYDCFDLAVKMANKGLAITLGELGHKRWKRLDFVRTHYGIESMDDFTIDNLIQHIQSIGRRNKKLLTVWQYREWQNTGRVYFTIDKLKVVEQWE